MKILLLIGTKNREAYTNFSSKLDNFIYEGDLALEAVPFDLNGNEEHQQKQIENILNI